MKIQLFFRFLTLIGFACVISSCNSVKVGLLAYYPLDNSGKDSLGKGNNGRVHNVTPTADRHGKLNAAYHFDGSTSYITIPDNQVLRLNNTDFTLNAWVNISSYNSSYATAILCKRIAGNDNGWLWGIQGNLNIGPGKILYGPGGGSTNAFGSHVVGLNSWHMLTGVYDLANSRFSIYIDGVLDSAVSGIQTTNRSITAALYIGRDDPSNATNGYFFQGSLDDIRIYRRKLSVAEIQKLFLN